MMLMAKASPVRQRGASKLELAVVAIIVGMLSIWLLHTFRFYEELTEKVVVESTITNLRSGLRFKIADLIIKGEGDRQGMLARSNPVAFAEQPPRGFIGELRKPGHLAPGSWYFDADSAELVYIPNLKANLSFAGQDTSGEARLRWQVRATDEGKVGQAIDIVLLTPYSWF